MIESFSNSYTDNINGFFFETIVNLCFLVAPTKITKRIHVYKENCSHDVGGKLKFYHNSDCYNFYGFYDDFHWKILWFSLLLVNSWEQVICILYLKKSSKQFFLPPALEKFWTRVCIRLKNWRTIPIWSSGNVRAFRFWGMDFESSPIFQSFFLCIGLKKLFWEKVDSSDYRLQLVFTEINTKVWNSFSFNLFLQKLKFVLKFSILLVLNSINSPYFSVK